MGIKRIIVVFMLALAGLGFALIPTEKPALAQGNNLLTNPSFEGDYTGYIPETPAELAECKLGVCQTAQVPAGWKPWWKKERPTDLKTPEFKPADIAGDAKRVRTGNRASQYFSFWSSHKAGLRQTITVPANSNLQFTAWGHAWLQEDSNIPTSDYAGTSNMRVGIDPTGGNDVYSPNIVWSEYIQALDSYQLFTVQAQAQGETVTVFTFSAPSENPNSPEYGFKHTDVYWDDASLVVTGEGAAPPPPAPVVPGGGSVPVNAVIAAPVISAPAATPDANGTIYAEAQPGDSIWALAARNGLSLDDILAMNSITRDHVVKTGDMFIVGQVDPPVAESEAAESEEAAGETNEQEDAAVEATEAPPAPSTPEGIAMVEQDTSGGAICLKAFNDNNANGVQDTIEELRAAVAFTISDGQSVVSNYVTDGESEPFCIRGLETGNYRVTRSSLPNETMTTPGDHSVALTEDSVINLEFGSFISSEQAADVVEIAETNQGAENSAGESNSAEAAESGDEGTANGFIIAGVIVVVLLLVGAVIFIFSSRRATT